MRKKVDDRIRTLIENGVKLRHRSMFIIVGDKSRDQVRPILSSEYQLGLSKFCRISSPLSVGARCLTVLLLADCESPLYADQGDCEITPVRFMVLQGQIGAKQVLLSTQHTDSGRSFSSALVDLACMFAIFVRWSFEIPSIHLCVLELPLMATASSTSLHFWHYSTPFFWHRSFVGKSWCNGSGWWMLSFQWIPFRFTWNFQIRNKKNND